MLNLESHACLLDLGSNFARTGTEPFPFEQAFEQAFEPCFEREPTVLGPSSSDPLVESKVQFSVLQICSENSN